MLLDREGDAAMSFRKQKSQATKQHEVLDKSELLHDRELEGQLGGG